MLVLVSVCLISIGVGCGKRSWSSKNVEESKKRGGIIVVALDNYKQSKGAYPKSLDELVPAYLASIPQPAAGNTNWTYIGGPPDSDFMLEFSGPTDRDPQYWFDSETRHWEWDTK